MVYTLLPVVLKASIPRFLDTLHVSAFLVVRIARSAVLIPSATAGYIETPRGVCPTRAHRILTATILANRR